MSDDVKYLEFENSSMINVSLLRTANPLKIPIRADSEIAGIILFTSGTTGIPKGIMLKHSSLRKSIEALTKMYSIGREVVLQQTAFSFDMSIDEVFVALRNRGTLFIVDTAGRGDSQALMKMIQSEGITYTHPTPPEYLSWICHGADYVADNHTWKHAFAGGDQLTDSLRQGFRLLGLPGLKIFNSYGPTEITLSAIKAQVDYQNDTPSEGNIPMGTAMLGYSIYILDDNLKPVAPGVPGKIVIGGTGVSLEYLNNETLFTKKFLDNPWASPEFIKNGWMKMYRTGDRGRITLDGQVLFHYRIEGDLQVKLRGIRTELEDIENSILQAAEGAFTDVVCTVRGDPEFVIAHVTFSPSFATEEHAFDNSLEERSCCHRRATHFAGCCIEDVVPDLNAMESELTEMWVEVLPEEMSKSVSTSDADFFRCGGSSLLMVELQSTIRRSFDINLSIQICSKLVLRGK